MHILIISGTPWYAHAGHQAPTQLAIAFRRLGWEVSFYHPSGHDYAVNNFGAVAQYGVTEVSEAVSADICLIEASPGPGILEAAQAARSVCGKVVYRCLDLWEGWVRDACHEHYAWADREYALVQLSDLVCAVSPRLAAWMEQQFHVPCPVVPNGAFYDEYRSFADCPKEKIALYVGNKLDTIRTWREIEPLASAYRDWTFLAVGHPATPAQYVSGNFFSLPELSDQALQEYYARASIGIIAHTRTWFCYFADPNKWYMYNACGMVIASTNVQTHVGRSFTVCGADLPPTFAEAVNVAAALPDRSAVPVPSNDWTERAKQILEATGL